jgi:aldose sugar dehydrogenase
MKTMIGTLERWNSGGAAWITALTCVALLSVSSHASAQQRKNAGGMVVAGRRPPDVPPVIGQPLETREPLGKGQKPAFAGQTRAVAVATKTPLRIEVVAQGLRNPWSLAFLPDGKMLVNEKPGVMRIVTRDGKIGDPIEGVPKVVFGGDAGLLDVALDPSFVANRLLYFTYVEPRENGGNGVAVAKARLSDDLKRLEDLAVILRVEPAVRGVAHYGSRLLFDKEGKLFVSLSERMFNPYRDQAQKLDSRHGKILRINTDGTPATGNPFAKTPGALPEIWSFGQRNPQGLTFHPQTGELWDTEHGPQAGDEVNVILPGKNYGWPVIAYGTEYDGRLINDGQTAKEGMEQPVYYWDPAIAPSGATFYSGELIPEWKNNLFVAALAGQHVSRLVLDGHRVVGEERMLLDQRQRMRDVRQGPDGALWVVTDDRNGRLIRIAPREP